MRSFLFLIFLTIVPAFTGMAQHTLHKQHQEELFETGLELVEKEKYAPARRTFTTYMNNDPDALKKIEAEYYVGYCALKLEQPDAEQLLVEWKDKYPKHPRANYVYYELGKDKYNNRHYESAIEYFDEIDLDQLDDETRAETEFSLAYAWFVTKELEKAEKLFDKIKKKNHAYTYAANYYSGYIKFKHGDYEQAVYDFKVAEQNENYAAAVPYMIVNVYYQEENHDKLIAYAEEKLQSDLKLTNKAEIVLMTAEAYFEKERYDKAVQLYSAYADAKTPESEAHYRMGYAYLQLKDYENAAVNFKKVASGSDSIGHYAAYYLAKCYIKTGNKSDAALAYEMVTSSEITPDLIKEAYFDLGKIYYEQKEFENAIRVLKDLQEEFPDNPYKDEADELIADCYLNSDDYDAALQYIEKLPSRNQRIDETYQEVAYYNGVELFNKRKFDEALNMFIKSTETAKDKSLEYKSWYWAGETYSILRRWDKAKNAYGRVFKLTTEAASPYHLKSRYGIGYAYFNTKNFEDAQRHFKHYTDKLATAKDKLHYDDALLRLADCYFKDKKYDQAIEIYDRARRENPDNTDYVYFQKGRIYSFKDEVKQANHQFNKVIEEHSNSPYRIRATYFKANMAFEKAKFEDAVDGFTYFIENEPNSSLIPFTYLQRAISYANLNQHEKAINDFDHILENYCNKPVAKQAISGVQSSLSDLDRGDEIQQRLDQYGACNPDDEDFEKMVYNTAMGHYESYDLDLAIKSFTKFLDKHEDSPLAKNAYYYLADAYYSQEKTDSAITYFKKTIEAEDKSHYEVALQRLSQLYMDKNDYRKAIKYNKSYLEVVGGSRNQIMAYADLMTSYYQLSSYDTCRFYANEILSSSNKVVWAQNLAKLHKGKMAYNLDSLDQAYEQFSKLLDLTDNVYGAEAYYMIAKIHYDKSEYDASLDTLKSMRRSYTGFPEWTGRSYLLTADNFMGKQDYFNARAVLKSLVDKFPLDEIREEAKQKMKAIDQLSGVKSIEEDTSQETEEVLDINQQEADDNFDE